MEDILDLYERPLEPGEGKVCVDERPYQLLADVQPPIPMEPEQPARQDYTYQRNGTCNLFVILAPEQGWRDVGGHRAADEGGWGPFAGPIGRRGFPGCSEDSPGL
ncbi:MAG: hypothetical protein RML46_10630 [Anaerolineae bacterium]|nr:hypothetical protein [Anaerolineae bacterium]